MSNQKTEYLFVLLHGWGGSGKSLESLARIISEEYSGSKVVNLELPGFGQTKLEHEYCLRDYALWLSRQVSQAAEELADSVSNSSQNAAQLPQLVLIGHSVGGKIILKLMDLLIDSQEADTPFDERLRQALFDAYVVLVASSGIKPRLGLKKTLFKLITIPYQPLKFLLLKLGLGDIEMLARKFFYKFIVGARDYEKLRDNHTLKSTFKHILQENLELERIKLIRNRSLLIWGEDDAVTPPWMGQLLDDLLPNSGLAILPNYAHGLPLKAPHEVAALVKQFLSSLKK